MATPFSTPFNWCDRRCERCPLTASCPIYRRQEQRDWVHRARKEDPDDWDVVMGDVAEDLTSALEMLKAAAEEEGIDLDAPPPKQPVMLEAVRVERAAHALMHAALAANPDSLKVVMVIVQKVARVASYVGQKDFPEVWDADGAPNLLLIERARAELGPVLGEPRSEDLERVLADFDRALAPLLAAVGDEARAELAALIARNEAPSPWCVLPEPPP